MIRITQLALAAAIPTALLSLAVLAQSTAVPSTAAQSTTAPSINQAPGTGTHHGYFQHALKKLDTDGDGRISLDEYLAGATARFQAADPKNTGSLTAAQLAASPQAQKHNLRMANMLVRHLDTAQKGYVTVDDFVTAAQTRFARLDTQGTGKLTEQQFAAAPVGRFAHVALAGAATTDSENATTASTDATPATPRAAFRQKFAQAEFAKLDTNGDGIVTRDEYIAAAKAKFAALDPQGTGKVTAQQIATSAVAQQRDLKFAQHEVKKLDGNGDGMVSLDEYLDGAKARFTRLDKNGDGYLDASDAIGHHWAHNKAAQPTS